MFKIEGNLILWEGRVVASFVGGLPATLRDDVESALECYEKDSVSREDHDNELNRLHVSWRTETRELRKIVCEFKNKFDNIIDGD